MPRLVRTKSASYLPQDEFDDFNLIEEEEEEDDELDDGDDHDQDDSDDEPDEGEDDDHEDDDHEDLEHGEDEGIEEDIEDDKIRKKPSRAQDRIRKLAAKNRKVEEELATLRAQQASFSQQQQTRQPQVNPAEEATFRASLSPEELIRYDVNKVLQANKQQTELQVFHMQDTMDRQAFQMKAATSPVHQRYAAEVERRLLDLRTNRRMNVPREVILANLVGEAVLTGKHKTVSRDTAKSNVKKNKTKPSSGRSDTTRENTRSMSEREKRRKRLESVTF